MVENGRARPPTDRRPPQRAAARTAPLGVRRGRSRRSNRPLPPLPNSRCAIGALPSPPALSPASLRRKTPAKLPSSSLLFSPRPRARAGAAARSAIGGARSREPGPAPGSPRACRCAASATLRASSLPPSDAHIRTLQRQRSNFAARATGGEGMGGGGTGRAVRFHIAQRCRRSGRGRRVRGSRALLDAVARSRPPRIQPARSPERPGRPPDRRERLARTFLARVVPAEPSPRAALSRPLDHSPPLTPPPLPVPPPSGPSARFLFPSRFLALSIGGRIWRCNVRSKHATPSAERRAGAERRPRRDTPRARPFVPPVPARAVAHARSRTDAQARLQRRAGCGSQDRARHRSVAVTSRRVSAAAAIGRHRAAFVRSCVCHCFGAGRHLSVAVRRKGAVGPGGDGPGIRRRTACSAREEPFISFCSVETASVDREVGRTGEFGRARAAAWVA